LLAIGLSVYAVWNAFSPLPPLQERSLFLLVLFALVFLTQAVEHERPAQVAVDLFWLALSLATFGYVFIEHEEIAFKSGIVTPTDMVLGIVCVFVVLEATRRIVGWALVMTALVFMLYVFYGQHLPRWVGGHGGFDLDRVITTIYLSGNGVFGVATYITFKFVFLFVMFGKLLEATGALAFIMEFTRALVGKYRGGPAMMAVVSSGMMGSVSGSAVANVMVTGSITIPLMKRVGFQPHVAGAVEAAASTGGQFMPPVMGAAAFLMMQFLAVDYLQIVKAAFIPAVLYFIGVLAGVYFYALRSGLTGLPQSELPSFRTVIREPQGLTFIAGIGLLIALLLLRWSPVQAVLRAMAVIAVLGVGISAISMFFQDRGRFAAAAPAGALTAIKKGIQVFEGTGRDFVMLGTAVACVGIIMGTILMTGLATRFASLVIGIAGGNFTIILLLTMFASMILGMGLPTSIAYIILALMVAPVLVKVGVLPIAAHLFIFFSGMLSMVTPPVALAAYAGATVAGSDFWRTSLFAGLISLPVYILPYAFVYGNALLMRGSPVDIVLTTATAAAGVILTAYAVVGALKDRIEIGERVVVFAAAIMLIAPGTFSDVIGLVLAVSGLARPLARRVAVANAAS
jgi:TRAP transporter 4TM/12TM fusion protein